MSNIPLARLKLEALMNEVCCEHRAALAEIMPLLYRRSAKRRAPTKSHCVDAVMAEHLRRYAYDNPEMTIAEIAEQHGINPGRVSEALHGDR